MLTCVLLLFQFSMCSSLGASSLSSCLGMTGASPLWCWQCWYWRRRWSPSNHTAAASCTITATNTNTLFILLHIQLLINLIFHSWRRPCPSPSYTSVSTITAAATSATTSAALSAFHTVLPLLVCIIRHGGCGCCCSHTNSHGSDASRDDKMVALANSIK